MNTIFIGIAGGSCSGKSTLTDKLKAYFGDELTVIYHDNYYKRRDELTFEDRKAINYDHPDALETSLLIEHINLLKNGQSIKCPVYDFSQHNRSDKTVTVFPSKVIIIEGILVFHEKALRDLFDIKIYCDADDDERLMRRAIRDTKERGRDIEGILSQYLSTVKPMHKLYVEPTKKIADIVINNAFNEVAFNMLKANINIFLKKE